MQVIILKKFKNYLEAEKCYAGKHMLNIKLT